MTTEAPPAKTIHNDHNELIRYTMAKTQAMYEDELTAFVLTRNQAGQYASLIGAKVSEFQCVLELVALNLGKTCKKLSLNREKVWDAFFSGWSEEAVQHFAFKPDAPQPQQESPS
jgi:hypothetical protein